MAHLRNLTTRHDLHLAASQSFVEVVEVLSLLCRHKKEAPEGASGLLLSTTLPLRKAGFHVGIRLLGDRRVLLGPRRSSLLALVDVSIQAHG